MAPKTPPKSTQAAPSKRAANTNPSKDSKKEENDRRGEGRKDKTGEENRVVVLRREKEEKPASVRFRFDCLTIFLEVGLSPRRKVLYDFCGFLEAQL